MSDITAGAISEADAGPWQAEITGTPCPFIWSVRITKGLMGFREWPPPAFGTRKRAEAVTRRRLRRLEQADRRRANRITITGGTPQ